MKRPLSKYRPFGPFVSESKQSRLNVGVEPSVNVFFHSSENMTELNDSSIHLMLGSPPYNVDWDYGNLDDQKNYNQEYIPQMARIFTEAYDKLAPGGRLCINTLTTDKKANQSDLAMGGSLPNAADLTTLLVKQKGRDLKYSNNADVKTLRNKTNYTLEQHIIWAKPTGSVRTQNRPFGSYPRPNSLFLKPGHESILVFRKPGNRDLSKVSRQRKDQSEISSSYFSNELLDDVWKVGKTQTREYNGFNVPKFPDELPERLIKMYSFVGDTVVDLFTGSGTTLKVAKELNRDSVGYEINSGIKGLIEKEVGVDL
jgi:DNA modification methylase